MHLVYFKFNTHLLLFLCLRIRPATIDYSGETSRASLSQNNPSPSSSRSSAPSGGGGGGGGGGSGGGGGAAGPVARDKPQVKSKFVLKVLFKMIKKISMISSPFKSNKPSILVPPPSQKSPPWWPKLSKRSRTDSPADRGKETVNVFYEFHLCF